MVRGLDIFREQFRDHQESLVLIGGAACDDWFAREGLPFRATQDLDVVLILEAVKPGFTAALRGFIADGGYEIRQRSENGPPILYRFAQPTDERYPHMLELFSRSPDTIDLGPDQHIVPIPADGDVHSLSAILLNHHYYALVREHHEVRDGVAFATAIALIPLKAHAWLDLSERARNGEAVKARDIAKHRTDVFRLAATLPGTPGPDLPREILSDLSAFLDSFPEESPEWAAILASLNATLGGNLKPAALRNAVRTYYKIA